MVRKSCPSPVVDPPIPMPKIYGACSSPSIGESAERTPSTSGLGEESGAASAPDKFQRCPTTGAREGLPASKQPT